MNIVGHKGSSCDDQVERKSSRFGEGGGVGSSPPQEVMYSRQSHPVTSLDPLQNLTHIQSEVLRVIGRVGVPVYDRCPQEVEFLRSLFGTNGHNNNYRSVTDGND